MYSVTLLLKDVVICEVLLKSITQVAKFVDTVDFDIVDVVVETPKHSFMDAKLIKEIWNA